MLGSYDIGIGVCLHDLICCYFNGDHIFYLYLMFSVRIMGIILRYFMMLRDLAIGFIKTYDLGLATSHKEQILLLSKYNTETYDTISNTNTIKTHITRISAI